MARGFNGEIIHFNAVRLRVTGSGNLRTSLLSLDDVNSATLPVLAMLTATNKELVLLTNFQDQMGRVRIETTDINETFILCKIVAFVRPVASGYPQ